MSSSHILVTLPSDKKETDFALTKRFLTLMESKLSETIKAEIKKYLAKQAENIDKLLNDLDINYILYGYLQLPTILLKERNKLLINMSNGYTFSEKPFKRCNDSTDKFIKLYHLALRVEENELAASFQKKIIAKILKYLEDYDFKTDNNHFFVVKIVSMLAYATDCFDKIKDALMQKSVEILQFYTKQMPGKKFDGYYYFSFLDEITNAKLLNEEFALKAKEPACLITDPEYYIRSVDIINTARPNTISSAEIYSFLLNYLHNTVKDNKHLTFGHNSNFISEFLKAALENRVDLETFELFMKNLKTDPVLIQHGREMTDLTYYFSKYFDNKPFNKVQNEIIKRYDPRETLEEEKSLKLN